MRVRLAAFGAAMSTRWNPDDVKAVIQHVAENEVSHDLRRQAIGRLEAEGWL